MTKRAGWLKNAFFWAAAAAQVVFLCLVSLRAGGAVVEEDAGKAYTHMMAMWDSGTLLVPDWKYITTMELDCTTLLALPVYGLTGNPILAYWLGNVAVLLAWVGLLTLLVRRLGGGWASCAGAACLVLLPYEFYMVGYWNMMFLNASQYAFKVMLPLLLITLLLAPDRPRRRDWALLGVYLAGCWLTAFSSGVYVAACGLAPVLVLAAWRWLNGHLSATPYRLACAGGSVGATLLGVGLQKALGVETSVSNMNLNNLGTFRDNAANCVVGFFRLFGCFPGEEASAFSPQGLATLLRVALAGGLLVAGVWFALRVLGGTLPQALRPACYPAALFWWNMAVLLALDTRYGDPYFEYRYHLMGAVPLLVLVALGVPMLTARPVRLRRAAAVLGGAGLLVLMVTMDVQAVGAIWQKDGTFGVNTPEREICGVVNTLDVEDVIVVDTSSTAEICGALDPNHRYTTLLEAEGQGMVLNIRDGRRTDTEGAYYTTPAAVVCPLEHLDTLPGYLTAHAQEVGRTDEYLILRTDEAPLVDGMVGMAYGDRGVDYPDSAWYTGTGTVDEDRCLHTDPAGGEVLRSAGLTLHRDTDITLVCATAVPEGTVGTLQLWQGSTLVNELPVAAGDARVTMGAPAGEGYCLVLVMDSGISADVSRVEFQAVN